MTNDQAITMLVYADKEYSTKEKVLLPLSLLLAILFDRLLVAPLLQSSAQMKIYTGVFWLCWLVIFYAVYWVRLKKSKTLWFVAGCSAALCLWNIAFYSTKSNVPYSVLTFLIIPAVLMAHMQIAAGGYGLKEIANILVAWLTGWLIKPFTGLSIIAGAAGSLVSDNNKPRAIRTVQGLLIALLMLVILVPLLSGADKMFAYHVRQLFTGWSLSSLFWHSVLVVIMFGLFFSVLWNVGYGKKETVTFPEPGEIDGIISGIVLGMITMLYVIFCMVQFTYLFAGAGLPVGMTYSEYAVEGFWQTVAVCFINIVIFGVFLRFGAKSKLLTGLLLGLLGLTGIMLFSGFTRLNLYVGAYGLTWLRLISAWFILYLSAVAVLCVCRIFVKKIPIIAVCGMLLLGWYVVLGYADPDGLIWQYNQRHHYDQVMLSSTLD